MDITDPGLLPWTGLGHRISLALLGFLPTNGLQAMNAASFFMALPDCTWANTNVGNDRLQTRAIPMPGRTGHVRSARGPP